MIAEDLGRDGGGYMGSLNSSDQELFTNGSFDRIFEIIVCACL